MQTTGPVSGCGKCAYVVLTAVLAATMPQAAGQDISGRIEKAVAVLNKFDDCLEACLRPEEFVGVDCAAIIPHFYRGAAVSGEVFKGGLLLETSSGRGFLSCRLGDGWSAPVAVTMTGGSRAIQIGENLDVVILWINKQPFPQRLSHHSAIDAVAASASASGISLADPDVKILSWGSHGKMSAGIDLQGAVLQPDDSVNKALYGKRVRNAEILTSKLATPSRAQPLVSRLSALFRR